MLHRRRCEETLVLRTRYRLRFLLIRVMLLLLVVMLIKGLLAVVLLFLFVFILKLLLLKSFVLQVFVSLSLFFLFQVFRCEFLTGHSLCSWWLIVTKSHLKLFRICSQFHKNILTVLSLSSELSLWFIE